MRKKEKWTIIIGADKTKFDKNGTGHQNRKYKFTDKSDKKTQNHCKMLVSLYFLRINNFSEFCKLIAQ